MKTPSVTLRCGAKIFDFAVAVWPKGQTDNPLGLSPWCQLPLGGSLLAVKRIVLPPSPREGSSARKTVQWTVFSENGSVDPRGQPAGLTEGVAIPQLSVKSFHL